MPRDESLFLFAADALGFVVAIAFLVWLLGKAAFMGGPAFCYYEPNSAIWALELGLGAWSAYVLAVHLVLGLKARLVKR